MPDQKKNHLRLFRSKKLSPEHVAAINRAIRHNSKGKEHNVLIEYTKADGTKTDRRIRPISVRGKHLLLAHDHNRGEVRSFRMDRVGMVKAAFWAGFEKRALFGFKKKPASDEMQDGVVHYHASWAGPSKRGTADLQSVAPKGANLKIIDVDNHDGDLSHVNSVPHTVVYKGGKIVDQVVGAAGKERYKKMFE